jgi:hypothetical protein
MDEVTIRVSGLDELELETLEVLRARRSQIKGEFPNGHIDGRHWLTALAQDARDILQRRRVTEARRAGRT